MLTGYQVARVTSVAAELGIADLLTSEPKRVDELARLTDTDPSSLGRLLRALASDGVFAAVDRETYALGPVSELLRSDVAGSRGIDLTAAREYAASSGIFVKRRDRADVPAERLYRLTVRR